MNPDDATTTTVRLEHPDEADRVVRVLVDAPARTPAPWVLVAHGFKGFARWGFFPLLAERLREAGYLSLRVDFSGNGVGDDGMDFSEHEAFTADTISRQLEDLDRVRDWLATDGAAAASATPGAFLGHSRGGGVGLIHCAERADYAAVALWSAIETFDRFDEATKARWRADGSIPIPNARTGQVHHLGLGLLEDYERQRARYDILAAAARLQAPCLVVHGTEDPTVDVSAARQLARALPRADKLEVEGAGHTFDAGHPLHECPPALESALQRTLRHLREHLPLAP